MAFDYFYPEQAEQFAFFRIPKILFKDRRFKHISTDAKVLYGLMLDRVSLSARNQWIDDRSRVSCLSLGLEEKVMTPQLQNHIVPFAQYELSMNL